MERMLREDISNLGDGFTELRGCFSVVCYRLVFVSLPLKAFFFFFDSN